MASIKDNEITKRLRKIITKDTLSTITPREIRNALEKALDMEQGSLDSERDRIKQLSQTVFTEVLKKEEDKDDDDDKPLNPPPTKKGTPAAKVAQKRKKDEDEEEEEAPKKTAKAAPKTTGKKTQDEFSIQIAPGSNPIYCKISLFRGKTMIDIRKYYTDANGEEKPTQKGISMTKDQWDSLQGVLPEVEEALKGFP